jgi:hypothetical protein
MGMGNPLTPDLPGTIFPSGAKRTIENWGDFGNVLLPDLLRVPRGVFVVCFAAALIALLVVLQQFTTR